MDLAQAESSGKKVIEVKNVTFDFGGKALLKNVSTTIFRGDRIGLIGPNGSGKTTLLKMLLGDLQPREGEVRSGSNLQIAYFDQYRDTLREDWSALENVSEGREFVEVGGKQKHVIGYLQDFLFTPERARAPITRLSGGERNRLLLAKLFAQPSNLLVMDEPTNDLDVETLELLEEILGDYPGTLLLVSHDRDFIDNVVTSTLVMEGDGKVGEYVGGYTDWVRQRPVTSAASASKSASMPVSPIAAAATAPSKPKRKLAYKESRELEALPGLIETLDTRIAAMTGEMNDPAFYQRGADAIAAHNVTMAELTGQQETAFARWAELEGED